MIAKLRTILLLAFVLPPSASAHDLCACFSNTFRDGVDLFRRFHRAGTGGNCEFVATYGDAAAKINDGAFRLEMAAGELEGLRNTNNFPNAFEQLEITMIEVAVDADGAEYRVRRASRAMNVEAAGDDAIDDVLDLLVGGVFVHDNDHG